MPVGLILRFPGETRAVYDAVNARLGIDIVAGTNFPDGLFEPRSRRGRRRADRHGSLAVARCAGPLHVRRGSAARSQEARHYRRRREITWIDPLASYRTPGRTAGV